MTQADQFPRFERGCALSIGKFDGLHCGHIALLETLLKKARQTDSPSVVFTFDRSPAEILAPESAPIPLCDLDQKIDLISAFSPDYLLIFPVTRPFLELSAEDSLTGSEEAAPDSSADVVTTTDAPGTVVSARSVAAGSVV